MRAYTLYWTNFRRYEECPQKFLWYCGWPGYDNGGGDGKPKPKREKKSEHHAVMGIVIGNVIERFYNDELWKNQLELKHRLRKMTEKEYDFILSQKYVDFRQSPTREEMLKICVDGVLGFLKTLKHNRLLGPYARSEINLLAYVNQYCPVGGRADIIIRRDDNGITILDGKNSISKGKYTDPDQLKWYALCFFLSKGVKPDRLGFVYYRYPYGTPIEDSDEIETGLDLIEWDKESDDLKVLAERAVKVSKGIHKEKFAPTPSPSACKFCDYEKECSARQGQLQAKRELRKAIKGETEEKNDFGGIIDLDF